MSSPLDQLALRGLLDNAEAQRDVYRKTLVALSRLVVDGEIASARELAQAMLDDHKRGEL